MLCRDCIAFVKRNAKTEIKYRLTDRHLEDSTGIHLFRAIGYCMDLKATKYERARGAVPAGCVKTGA